MAVQCYFISDRCPATRKVPRSCYHGIEQCHDLAIMELNNVHPRGDGLLPRRAHAPNQPADPVIDDNGALFSEHEIGRQYLLCCGNAFIDGVKAGHLVLYVM